MVKSLLDTTINFPEIKRLDSEDANYDATLYEISLLTSDITIALGQAKYAFVEKNVVYYPIYLVKNDKVSSQIGVYEVFADKVPNILDSDGDVDLELLGEPLIYSYVNDALLNKGNEKRDNFSKEQIDDDDEDEDEEDEEDEDEDMLGYSPLPVQTEEMARREKDEYKEIKDQAWIAKFMHNNNYKIVGNEGGGDCLFAVIRDGLEKIGQKVTVADLRKKLSENITVDTYEGYKMQYELIENEISILNKEIKDLTKKHKELKTKLASAKDRSVQSAIVEQAEEVGIRHKQAKIERTQAKELMEEFQFMKGITSFEAFKAILQTCEFWGDSVAISTLERVLNIKLVLFSNEAYRSKDLDNVLQCGQLNDTILQEKGKFEPSHYILANYIGNHYELVTYKNRTAFTFNELPYDVKILIKNKCLEKNAGPYYLIPEFKDMTESITIKEIDIMEPDGDENAPIVEIETSVEEPGSKMPSDLYNEGTVFQFYSRSGDKPKPGKGSGEDIGPEGYGEYIELASIPEWRKKLSNFWAQEFELDGKKWLSVEHYYQGSKFKRQNPEFYNQFSLDSDSKLSREPDMAKAAGGKTGKYKSEVLRSKEIKADSDFFEGRDKKEMINAMRAKFTQNEDLKKLLRATKKAKLVHYVGRGKPVEVFNNLMEIRKEIS